MEVSGKKNVRLVEAVEPFMGASVQSNGQELLEQVISLTGLPDSMVRSELGGILENSGISSESLTLESLRSALLEYLQKLAPDSEPLN